MRFFSRPICWLFLFLPPDLSKVIFPGLVDIFGFVHCLKPLPDALLCLAFHVKRELSDMPGDTITLLIQTQDIANIIFMLTM
ncbi:hypothetical protein [Undibacterium curvum]|uniref:Secreted protein n=1 Tax=Undibacterium curvum TaxID=2762294 RepID=A0ABR7A6C1_9BURK|nr:hypothetical protein [Undibacterium curvum]MBC3932430.1 hypothetical protein [Undibacterium curvum]